MRTQITVYRPFPGSLVVLILSVTLLAFFIATGCGGDGKDDSEPAADSDATTTGNGPGTQTPIEAANNAVTGYTTDISPANKDPEAVHEKTTLPEPTAVIDTERGTIRIRLYINDAPQTVKNFIGLAQEGYYDGITFHRVIEGFMTQTGDPTATGSGGKTCSGKPLPDEIDGWALGLDTIIVRDTAFLSFLKRLYRERLDPYLDRSLMDLYKGVNGYTYVKGLSGHKMDVGSIAMANSGANTNSSQFFIVTMSAQPHLDGKHTVFGEVTEGLDIARKLRQGETLNSVTIIEP